MDQSTETPGDVRWLTPAEQDAWRALAGVVIKLPAALEAQLQRDSQLTLFEYFVLSALSAADCWALSMGELAAIVNGSLSRLSNVIKKLEIRGAVRREPSPDNRRYTHAILTNAGWDLLVAAAPKHAEAVRRHVFDMLTEDQVAQLTTLARGILRGTEPDACWP
ncbi:MAG TPA: MarR family transcriptional regulator [Pseudonocardiaceae bacterium]|nr:MarR family transcriptional regulator [Pseudonocardiaceae bacterium]